MPQQRSSEFPNLLPMPANRAVLEESNDEKGTCVRRVSLAPDALLRLEGHDLGPFVQQFFIAKGIESEFWSRIGD